MGAPRIVSAYTVITRVFFWSPKEPKTKILECSIRHLVDLCAQSNRATSFEVAPVFYMELCKQIEKGNTSHGARPLAPRF